METMVLSMLLTLTCIVSCNSESVNIQESSGLVIVSQLKGCFKLLQDHPVNDSSFFYLVEIKLSNTSNHPIEFITYTCTTSGNVVTNNELVTVCRNRCSANGHVTIKLAPQQEFCLPIILQTNLSHTSINIGWIYLNSDSDSLKNILDISKALENKIKTLKDVVWSKPLYLHASGGSPFELR